METLHVIAEGSEPAYYAMLSYPRFARDITPGKRLDYMIKFGHDVRVEQYRILWYRNGRLHRINGPAVMFSDGGYYWLIDGEMPEYWCSNMVKYQSR